MFKKLLFLLVFFGASALLAQKSVTIYWDTSLSMKERAIEKEFNFLEDYFTKNKNTAVILITFSNQIIEKETTSIINGDWLSIKEKLKRIPYDGGTSYSGLSSYYKGGDVLMFTDGNENMNRSAPRFEGALFIINTNSNFNEEKLKQIALASNGQLANLATITDEVINESTKELYTGQVFYENKIANDITVHNKTSDQKVGVDSKGFYAISAEPGDVITFNRGITQFIEKKLGLNRVANIWIDRQGVRLEEVLINAQKKKDKKKEQVYTLTGVQNKEALGYAVQTIKREDLHSSATNVSELIDGKSAGITKGIEDDLSQTLIRGITSWRGNNYAALSIDGVVIAQSDSKKGGRIEITDFIDVNNIAEITVLKGFAATNSYGTLGRNGVIEITTKTLKGPDNRKQKENTALVKNNIYTGKIATSKNKSKIAYLSGLRKASSAASAYQLYLREREKYWDHPSYFIDVFNLFAQTNEQLAFQIISNILEREYSPFAQLRSMYLTVSEKGNSNLALEVATTLLNKFPQQTQSYMDVAMAHIAVENYQTALDLLLAIADGSMNPNLDFSGLQKIANNEIKSLVALRKGALNTSRIRVQHSKVPNLDARIIFDWNNSDAEFELQFVNPTKRFFKWFHTDNNAERIQDELQNGFTQEEFEIEGGQKGQWIINLKYLGNRTPRNKEVTFLKYTVQYNFGKPSQRNETRVVRLSKKGEEQLLTKIMTK